MNIFLMKLNWIIKCLKKKTVIFLKYLGKKKLLMNRLFLRTQKCPLSPRMHLY